MNTAQPTEFEFDVVVFGATSFVGQILSHYLMHRHGGSGKSLRWAMAGRSVTKLAEVQRSLGDAGADIALIVADASDETSLRALCDRTCMVVSTVGPYALYGEPLVAACVASGTHYCDLTGEPQWIAEMLSKYEAEAKKSGAHIVHSCGFDSIPSDLGAAYTQAHFIERFGHPASEVKMRVRGMKGTFSGGTAASMVNAAKEVIAKPEVRAILKNPYSLCPPDKQLKTRQPNVSGAVFDTDAKSWVAPFVMAAINTRVVLRSQALADHDWGEDFVYDEAMMMGAGLSGRVAAMGLAAGLAGFFAGAALPPTRWLMEKTVLPAPGEGPSPEAQAAGYWDYRFFARDAQGNTLRTRVTGDRDPGYGSTAKMLGEAAACLALDISNNDLAGGFWTPATAMGDKLQARLIEHAGVTFEVLK